MSKEWFNRLYVGRWTLFQIVFRLSSFYIADTRLWANGRAYALFSTDLARSLSETLKISVSVGASAQTHLRDFRKDGRWI